MIKPQRKEKETMRKNRRNNRNSFGKNILRFIFKYIIPVAIFAIFVLGGIKLGFMSVWNEAGQYYNMDRGVIVIPVTVILAGLISIVINQSWIKWLRKNNIIR